MFFVKREMSLFVQIIVLFIMQTDIYEVSFFEISMVLTDQMIATTVIVVEMRYPTIIKCFNFILNLYLIPLSYTLSPRRS